MPESLMLLLDDGLFNFNIGLALWLAAGLSVLPDWEGAGFFVPLDDIDGGGLLYAELGNRIFERGRPPENELNEHCFFLCNGDTVL